MFAVGGWFVLFVGEEWDSVANPDVQTGENVGYFCCSTSLDATARGVGCVFHGSWHTTCQAMA